MLTYPCVGFSGPNNVSWGYQTPIPRICNCPFIWKKDLCKCDKDTEVGRIPHVRWALNASACVLTRGRQEAMRDTQREDCIKMGAEMGRMQPHAQECPRPPAARRGRCAPEPQRECSRPHRDFCPVVLISPTSGLQRINFCCFESPSLWHSVTGATENQYRGRWFSKKLQKFISEVVLFEERTITHTWNNGDSTSL